MRLVAGGKWVTDGAPKVIDLAANFRLRDPKVWSYWYVLERACPRLLSEAVYGSRSIAAIRADC